jgi:hypothetical protein
MNASSAVDWVIVRPVILTSESLKIYEEFQQSAVSNTAHSTLFVESQEDNSGKFSSRIKRPFPVSPFLDHGWGLRAELICQRLA